ncbi:MAG: hypothetical protein AAF378_14080 [Cyanobacteria bacterium P01_A01_bin.84]
MAKKKNLLTDISLNGLEIAPSQVSGSVRIVPLLRRKIRGDLRLQCRPYNEDVTIVSLEKDTKYISYVPHGLIVSWSDDGSPIAAYGGQMKKAGVKNSFKGENYQSKVQLIHRMVKRESKNQLRFLPLHLAMEGFLSMFFSAPDIAWCEYSKYALSNGLGLRYETTISGRYINGLEEALRIFEIYERQVGVLVFVAEALASAFVVPTPEDYRLLHASLIEDFYGELLYQYGLLYQTTFPMTLSINEADEAKIDSLLALRKSIDIMRQEWASFQGFMAEGLLKHPLKSKITYTIGSFTLQRFITDLQVKTENHIGEAIIQEDGELEYLKTYRLSATQSKRVYLLSQLAVHNWNIHATAKSLGYSHDKFVLRLKKSNFGYLLNKQVCEKAKAKKKG